VEEGRGLYIEVQDYMVYVMYTRSARPFTCVGLYFLVRRRNALKWLHQEDTTSSPSQQRTMPLPTDDARLYYRETLLSRTLSVYRSRFEALPSIGSAIFAEHSVKSSNNATDNGHIYARGFADDCYGLGCEL